MVLEGLGVALISENAVRRLQSEGELLVFELPLESAERDLNIVYRKKNIFRPYEEIFVDYVVSRYK
jgi:DNA-binding transcriptional LysR family regulator